MNEINVNALSHSVGIDKSLKSIASQKTAHPKNAELEPDSTQFSELPDLSAVEKSMEDEFASLRANLQDEANSPSYPPLETIDRLAHMLAINLKSQTRDLPQ